MIVQYPIYTPLGVMLINNTVGLKQYNVGGTIVNDVASIASPALTSIIPAILNTRRDL